MAGGRGERVDFIDFLDQGTDPTEDGFMQRNGSDLLIHVSGAPKSVFDVIPPATQVGQVLYSTDGSSFSVQLPLASCEGWLVNDEGILLVVG